MTNYAWIIDRDHIATEGEPPGTLLNAKGLTGPRLAPDVLLASLAAGNGIAFRMRDDDGELYYEGRIACPDDESMFAPLDDFGMPNAGCTGIEYKSPVGAWVYL